MRHFRTFSFILSAILLFALVLATQGCISPAGIMMAPGHDARATKKIRGPGADGTEDVTVFEMQVRLFDLADLWASLIKSLLDPVAAEAKTHDVRSAAIELKLRAITSGYAIGASPDPVGGILDMMVLSRLLNKTWAMKERAQQNFGPFAETVSAGLAAADEAIWRSAGNMLTEQQKDELEAKIDKWLASMPNIQFVTFARLNDIDSVFDTKLEAEVSKSQGLMDVLDSALRSAEEYRLLGERSLWLAARAPVLIRMSVEASIQTVVDEPTFREALQASNEMPRVVDRLITTVEQVPKVLDQQRDEIMKSIDSSMASLHPALSESREVIERATVMIREARALASEPNPSVVAAASAAKDLRDAAQMLQDMIARFSKEPANTNSPSPISEFAKGAADLNGALATLNILTNQPVDAKGSRETPFAEISHLADLKVALAERASRDLINYAFWRLLVLIGVFFVGMFAYRVFGTRGKAA